MIDQLTKPSKSEPERWLRTEMWVNIHQNLISSVIFLILSVPSHSDRAHFNPGTSQLRMSTLQNIGEERSLSHNRTFLQLCHGNPNPDLKTGILLDFKRRSRPLPTGHLIYNRTTMNMIINIQIYIDQRTRFILVNQKPVPFYEILFTVYVRN